MKQVRVAVIGIGNMGSAHATCIAEGKIEGLTLTAICDINDKKVERFLNLYPSIRGYTSYEIMLADQVCDGVIIAVPHRLHSEMAIQAFQKGLNVMLEKPADISVAQAKRMNQAAKEAGTVFSIMFNQRTNPLFAKARQLVQSGQLGELKRMTWTVTNWFRTQHYYDSGEWRATWSGEGGGVLLNQAPHNLDLWQWICGMPESVTAFCDVAKYHQIEVEDDVTMYVKYKNGATGVFMTSTGEYPGTNRLEISGDLGKLVLESQKLKWFRLKKSVSEVIITSQNSFEEIEYECEEMEQTQAETSHKGILQNFANAILQGEELIAPGEDGIYELTLSNAAYLSQWQGNRMIELPIDDSVFQQMLEERQAESEWKSIEIASSGKMSYRERWQVRW